MSLVEIIFRPNLLMVHLDDQKMLTCSIILEYSWPYDSTLAILCYNILRTK